MTIQKFEQLPEDVQKQVIDFHINQVVKDIAEGYMTFGEDDNDLNARVRAAWEEMEKLRTPWFIGERLLEDAELKMTIISIAEHQAARSLYSDGEVIVPLEMVRHFTEQAKGPKPANSNN